MKKKILLILMIILVLSGCSGTPKFETGTPIYDIIVTYKEYQYMSLTGLTAYKIDGDHIIVYEGPGIKIGKLVVFSPDRICKENKGFSLKIIGDISCLLNKSLNQVEEEYGKHDVAVASGPFVPGYITEDGYLVGFSLDINDIVGLVRKIDLLTGETVETVSAN